MLRILLCRRTPLDDSDITIPYSKGLVRPFAVADGPEEPA
jgi:hypothetical protein